MHWQVQQECTQLVSPISFILLQVFAKILPNNRLVATPLGLAPPVWNILDLTLFCDWLVFEKLFFYLDKYVALDTADPNYKKTAVEFLA